MRGEGVDFRALWDHALTFEQFLLLSREEHRALWEGIYRHMKVPEWVGPAVEGLRRNLLVITEDWCMDASSTIPALVRVAEAHPDISLRIILRDQNPDLMNRYLTNGSRSIPVVIILDEFFQELGHWGPRPSELQRWFVANRTALSKEENVRERRRWYARDRGETTLREVLKSRSLGV